MMKVVKNTYSKNNNEIVLVEQGGFCSEQNPPTKTILIIGVFHGEEPQGKFLIENYLAPPPPLREMVGVRGPQKSNQLLFIPCLNPDGLAINKRQNANGVDLNRNFPTYNWTKSEIGSEYYGGEAPASEIETKFVIEILEEYKPDVILTLHAPYKVVNHDGPAKEIAEKISEIIGYPVQSDIGYPTPGSFGTYCGVVRNIPTITLEFDEEIAVKDLIEPFEKIINYLSTM